MPSSRDVTEQIRKPIPKQLLHPKYWMLWLGLGILKLTSLLPYRLQLLLGQGIGYLGYFAMRRRRHIAQINIALCFPHLDEKQRETIVRKSFQSLAMSIFETLLSWWAPDKRLAPLGRVEGLEHLKNAAATGKGIILLTGHFTCLEIAGRILLPYHDFIVMYKRHRNPLFEYVIANRRETICQSALQQDDIRGMLTYLKNGQIIWYAPDQDLGANRSVFAPFMGVQTATIVAPSRFAKMTGALVVPYFPERLPHGQGYQLNIYPALENFPGDDEVENATRINELIAAHVRRVPDQYLWLHRRFKSRPPGEASVYD